MFENQYLKGVMNLSQIDVYRHVSFPVSRAEWFPLVGPTAKSKLAKG
jgi:hypothetical protein